MSAENRLPFTNAFGGWMAAGNWDSVSSAHAASQPFAWDFRYTSASDPDGTSHGKIYAARAGHVVRVINNVPHADPQLNSEFAPAFTATPFAPSGYGGSARGGNQVMVRHADGTVFCYCHMKSQSIVVAIGDYVMQGTLLGVVGATGSTSGGVVHTHFERLTWANPRPYGSTVVAPNIPFNLDNYQGSSVVSHFEGMTTATNATPHAEPWRPDGSEAPPGQAIPFGQDGWRACGQCASLFFDDPNWGPGVCPQGGGPHVSVTWTNYTLRLDVSSPGQANWKWCKKCMMLFYSAGGATSCPVTSPNSSHDGSLSNNYHILFGASATGEHGWRWCSKCQSLWSSNATTSKCPFDAGSHSQGSTDYVLSASSDDIQLGWRACSSCLGLFHGSGSYEDQVANVVSGNNGVCPATSGGLHAAENKHVLFHSVSPANASGSGQTSTWQEQWAWCSKCQVLYYGPRQSDSVCPVGPVFRHSAGSNTNYIMLFNSGSGTPPVLDGTWRWCGKCMGLVRGTASCSAGGTHDISAGSNYSLVRDLINT